MKKSRGITVIALIITIIVLLILAAVVINVLFGEDGIINKAKLSSFATEMTKIKENVNLKKSQIEIENMTSNRYIYLFDTHVKISDDLPDTLKQEVMYFRDGALSEKSPSEYNASEFENFVDLDEQDIDGLWIIDKQTADGKENTYIYDEKTDIVFKIEKTEIAGKVYHSYEAATMKKGGNPSENTQTDTIINEEFNDFKSGYYEPNLQGFDSSDTYIVYYSENILTSNDNVTTKLVPIKQYIDEGKQRKISQDGVNYIAYDYSNQVWANVVTKANGVESWWVWMPRYAYNTQITENKFDILFTTVENKVIVIEDDKTEIKDLSEFPDYISHPGFTKDENIELKGIWMSKFNPTQVISGTGTEKADNLCYKPDMEGFDTENTYMVYYSSDFSKTYQMKLSEYNSKKQPRTITQENETYTLYDYANKTWANAVTKANGIEAWWVWVPRYAYSNDIVTGEFSIIFVDTNDKPMDKNLYGTSLPRGYELHPGFNVDGNKLKGIWMSKFNPTQSETYTPTINTDNLCYKPDMEGFDTENTYMVYYSSDFSKTYQMKLSEYKTKGEPRTITQEDGIYTLYDYSNKTWANAVTKANGIEAWWVWIPRYAYSNDIIPGEFSIIFVDTDDKPIDTKLYGTSLPKGYELHPGFNVDGNKLKGIWMSKFNPTQVADPVTE